MDVKPGSCPNSFDTTNAGLLPIALVGLANFDVHQVDTSSLRLWRDDCVGGSVAPLADQMVYEDAARPFYGTLCDCQTQTRDRILDLSLKFDSMAVANALQLGSAAPNANITLALTGRLQDGTEFVARDCIRIAPRR